MFLFVNLRFLRNIQSQKCQILQFHQIIITAEKLELDLFDLDAEEMLQYLSFLTIAFVNTHNICHINVAVIVMIVLLFPNHRNTKLDRFSGTFLPL